MDCESSEEGIAALRREYETLVEAGVGATHEWLDSEDELAEKVPILPRENLKVGQNPEPSGRPPPVL